MNKQPIKTNVTVFGPDENARFTVHAANCRAIIECGHLEEMTIRISSRSDVVADVYAFLSDEDQASALKADFDFCSCVKSLPTNSAGQQ